MLSFLVTLLIIVSIIYTFGSDSSAISNAVLGGCSDAVSLCLNLAGAMGLWGGVMKVAERCGITEKITKIIGKPISLLFRGLNDKTALNAISLNVTANLLGLGNAATPLGIKAMKRLCRKNVNPRHTTMFVLLNTASIQLIPLTVSSMRMAHGAANPWDCTLPAILTSIGSVSVGAAVSALLYASSEKT
jgi:spore maturation protein A